jgi:hypothetical protein
MRSRALHRAVAASAILLWFTVNPGCAQIAGITDSAPKTCTNGVQDADEDGIDCGGTCLGGCQGAPCGGPGDCASGHCLESSGTCEEATCKDGIQNGGERGVDCGGSCLLCDRDSCTTHQECASGLCLEAKCRPLSCFNSTLDGSEEGVDCGGACLACEQSNCTKNAVCASQTCNLVFQKCACSHCANFIDGGVPPAPATICPASFGLLTALFTCICKGNCATDCNSCVKFNTELEATACSTCVNSLAGCGTEAALCQADI